MTGSFSSTTPRKAHGQYHSVEPGAVVYEILVSVRIVDVMAPVAVLNCTSFAASLDGVESLALSAWQNANKAMALPE